jgi:hypothetical protein
MTSGNSSLRSRSRPGFTLAAVLVIVGALLILAVGILLVSSIERSTARLMSDRERAKLAARAGLEEVRAIFARETANDGFVILQSALADPIVEEREPAPYLFIARGTGTLSGTRHIHRYVPLFSASANPANGVFSAPQVAPLLPASEAERVDFTTLPYLDPVRAAWVPVRDGRNRIVARYAYWIEDLQGRVDPAIVGNEKGVDGDHARVGWPFPAPGLNDQPEGADEPALDQIALFAIDPSATDGAQGDLGKTLIKNRPILVSPDSQLAAANIQPPLTRLTAPSPDGGFIGDLADPAARAVERGLATGLQPYLEQPIIPYADGITAASAGTPKLNLNELLAMDRSTAIDEMAAHIRQALPNFDQRKGGFPDDYVKTLAANALDYADEDNEASIGEGYRGIDAYPFTSELVLKVDYRGMTVESGRQYLNFNIRLFAELYNPSNVDVSGEARISYECALRVSPIGIGTGMPSFDKEELLDTASTSTHDLDKIGSQYWSKPVQINLRPNQYQSHLFCDVTYRLDHGTPDENEILPNTPFSLLENKGASGSSLMWKGNPVERQQGVVRQQGFIYNTNSSGNKISGYHVGIPDILSKCHLPGLLYQKPSSSAFYGTTGDPRISHYLNRALNSPLDESAYPENASPNRRNIRRNIYNPDAATKPKVYARSLPSEWPDGGHDNPVGTWTPGTDDATEMTEARFNLPYVEDWKYHSIQRISNRGFFLSATELGHVFDPIMYAPVFDTTTATNSFWSNHMFPAGIDTWPDMNAITDNSRNVLYGGGNTLRIGRPEHPAFHGFDGRNMHAASLLDLFHTGQPASPDPELRKSPVNKIEGQVNINTAARDALRLLAAGGLTMDPMLSARTSSSHSPPPLAAPPWQHITLDAPKISLLADKVADAVIASRPFASPSAMASARDSDGRFVFGNRAQYPQGQNIRWTDAAAEEVFARVYQASSVRSRNFRVWIVAQAIAPMVDMSQNPEILAETRTVHTMFIDPGRRNPDGGTIGSNFRTTIQSSNDF